MSANHRVVIHLLTLKCGPPLDAVPSRNEMKLAERIASILQDFELRHLEIDEVEKLEVVEEEDQEFQQEEECAGVTTPLGTITFSGGQIVSEEKVVSLVYRLLCHPCLGRLIEFAWYKASYLTTHPRCFENLSDGIPGGPVMSQDVKKL